MVPNCATKKAAPGKRGLSGTSMRPLAPRDVTGQSWCEVILFSAPVNRSYALADYMNGPVKFPMRSRATCLAAFCWLKARARSLLSLQGQGAVAAGVDACQ